jgi:hypothetical protein
MSGLQKGFALLVGLGIITTLVLPDRKTAQIITAGGGALKGVFGTLISGKG